MSDTEIENTIRKYIFLKKNISNEENKKEIQYYTNLLLKYSLSTLFLDKI